MMLFPILFSIVKTLNSFVANISNCATENDANRVGVHFRAAQRTYLDPLVAHAERGAILLLSGDCRPLVSGWHTLFGRSILKCFLKIVGPFLANDRRFLLLGTVGLSTIISIATAARFGLLGPKYILGAIICAIQSGANFQMLLGELRRRKPGIAFANTFDIIVPFCLYYRRIHDDVGTL